MPFCFGGAGMECLLHPGRCLPAVGLGKPGETHEDAVLKLTSDMELLTTSGKAPPLSNKRAELCKDVQKQLHCILDMLKDLSEKPENGTEKKRKALTDMEVHVIDEFIAADLPVQLLAQMEGLEFEARKEVMNVCSALLWPGLPHEVERQVLEYFRHHKQLFQILMNGYTNEEVALHTGVVLRSCLRHSELVEAFLASDLLFELMSNYVRHQSLDIAADAFYSLREALMAHKEVAGPWLNNHFEQFFQLYNPLLQSEDYVLVRQALTLLSHMLLDRNFQRVMISYATNDSNLRIVMNLLRDSSCTIQTEAFHVFKLFVINPKKTNKVQYFLAKNKDKLVALLQTLKSLKPDDDQFGEDQQTVIDKLIALKTPARKPTLTGSGDIPRCLSEISIATTAEPDHSEVYSPTLAPTSTSTGSHPENSGTSSCILCSL